MTVTAVLITVIGVSGGRKETGILGRGGRTDWKDLAMACWDHEAGVGDRALYYQELRLSCLHKIMLLGEEP